MQKILITGGAGFIGTSATKYFINKGWHVSILDNLSRSGAKSNLKDLKKNHLIDFYNIDIRKWNKIVELFKHNSFDMVLHLAGQVAVTISITDPREDFEINALGTLNILEALRKYNPKAFFLNASTNKVYGAMNDLKLIPNNKRYEYVDHPEGIDETFPLDFHSPYGCSKGSADQYTIDYARIYGIKTTSFRQSCIYGAYQYGEVNQGWIAWFTIAILLKKSFKIYGNGKQVRDILYVDDLIRANELAYKNKEKIAGEVFNIGGGNLNTMSLLELFDRLSTYQKNLSKDNLNFDKWRSGDQKIFVSNISKAKKFLNWKPKYDINLGFDKLYNWTHKNKEMIERTLKFSSK